MSGMASVLV